MVLPGLSGSPASVQPVEQIAALVRLDAGLPGQLDVDVPLELGNEAGLPDVYEHCLPLPAVRSPGRWAGD